VTNQTENQKIKEKDQSSINNHDSFNSFVSEGLRIGSHIVGSKGSGKTRLLFCIAQELIKQPNVRTIIFDGSETWIYAFNRIPVFTIGEHDILETSRGNIQDFEKYSLKTANLVKICLETHKDVLFRLKTRKPSKRGFFIRTVINFLDSQQRAEKTTNPEHENTKAIAYFIEEAQNAFSSRSTSSTETEEFLTVFNEARNNREGFFTSSQRLTDFSKTIRSKQIQCLGRLSNEDISPNLRRLEKAQNIDFSKMKPRNWFYEGSIFVSPEFKQNGKPFQVNREIKKLWLNSLPKKKTLAEKIKPWLTVQKETNPFLKKQVISQTSSQLNEMEKEDIEDEKEDSQGDGLFMGDPFFPEEFDDEEEEF
jgi:energy-coupling factor transporter ATP-binding protein EcfA2